MQIKETISSLLTETLEKLDSNVSDEDSLELKKILAQTQEFQKEIQRYLNGNVELGRDLGQLASKIPAMAPKVKDLDHIDSIAD